MVRLVASLSRHGGPVSGQALAREFSITRSALQQRICRLRDQGFVIRGRRGSGYLLLDRPDTLAPENVLPWLHTEFVGQTLAYAESCESTNDIAKQLAQDGAVDGTCVLAEAQTRGRGRQGRSWYSPPGQNVYMSLILRPNVPLQHAPILTLAAAVATWEATHQVSGLSPVLKWPNDLLVATRKLCGILTEMAADPDGIQWIVVGIGCNVNATSFPPELSSTATSLRLELGRRVSRAAVTVSLLERMEHWYRILAEEGPEHILVAWRALPNILGREVSIHLPGGVGTLRGTAERLADDGCLVLRTPQGSLKKVLAGDVLLAEPR